MSTKFFTTEFRAVEIPAFSCSFNEMCSVILEVLLPIEKQLTSFLFDQLEEQKERKK